MSFPAARLFVDPRFHQFASLSFRVHRILLLLCSVLAHEPSLRVADDAAVVLWLRHAVPLHQPLLHVAAHLLVSTRPEVRAQEERETNQTTTADSTAAEWTTAAARGTAEATTAATTAATAATANLSASLSFLQLLIRRSTFLVSTPRQRSIRVARQPGCFAALAALSLRTQRSSSSIAAALLHRPRELATAAAATVHALLMMSRCAKQRSASLKAHLYSNSSFANSSNTHRQVVFRSPVLRSQSHASAQSEYRARSAGGS